MSGQELPKGLTHKKVKAMIEHYEKQSGADAVAEMEEALASGRGYRTMHVPIEAEVDVLRLIAAVENARKGRAPKPIGQVSESRKRYGGNG